MDVSFCIYTLYISIYTNKINVSDILLVTHFMHMCVYIHLLYIWMDRARLLYTRSCIDEEGEVMVTFHIHVLILCI